jgi:hypothetical protein
MYTILKTKQALTAGKNSILKLEKQNLLIMKKGLINIEFEILILIESRKSHSFQSMNKLSYPIEINRR